ncbi:hypothetical protein FQA39_LY17044 [Lamprigera yunnana]|nr:hypothetical protein FQA39_LY17044 [Lamprigera yunnana]
MHSSHNDIYCRHQVIPKGRSVPQNKDTTNEERQVYSKDLLEKENHTAEDHGQKEDNEGILHTTNERLPRKYRSDKQPEGITNKNQKSKPVKLAKGHRRTDDRKSEKNDTTVGKDFNTKMAQKQKCHVPSMKVVLEARPSGVQTKVGSTIYAEKIVLLI